MKLSKFNNFISLQNDKVLGYNAFTRRYIVMPSYMASQIANLNTEAEFKQLEGSTSQYLREAGFIIDNDIDELATLDNEINELDGGQSSYDLTINPTLDCNFKCWYCYERHKRDTKLNEDIFNRIKKHLLKTLNPPIEQFHLSFFGGEPLLQFEDVCKPIIQFANDLCSDRKIKFRIHFTSNSFLITKAIANFLGNYKCSFQITLDGSREFHNKVRSSSDKTGSYDQILENVEYLANHGIFITLRVNYTLGNIKSAKEIITDLHNRKITHPENINLNFQRVWQDFHNGENETIKSLLKEYKEQLFSYGFNFSIPDLINPRSSSCYGDKVNSACINYNGDFYKCTARDFTKENRCGYLDPEGNLIWDENKETIWASCKFSKSICRSCRIAPICLSGCRQKGIESINSQDCPLQYTEQRKDELILQKFEAQYMNSESLILE